MNNLNNSCNNEEEETKLIISLLLTDMITEVLLMREQNLAKLNRERILRCRERKRQRNPNEYTCKKSNLAFDIIKITFQIEEWLQQVPGSLVHNMATVQFERYSKLAKEKTDMIEEIGTLMVNYEDM